MTYPSYNSTNTCDRCGRDLLTGWGNPHREYDKNGKWTGKYLCNKCYCKDRYDKIKCNITDRRTGNQDPND